jgi:sec-independent protein translocase protein TatB
MFDFDVGKLLLIGVVALIFIPPKDLPQALRQIGRLVGKARRMAADFQSQFNEAIRDTELDDLKNEFRHLKDQASVAGAMGQVADIADAAGAPLPAETPAPEPAATEAAATAEGPAGPALPDVAPNPPAESPAATGTHS